METVIERNNVVLTESPAAAGISAVSWPAVFAGAVAAAAISLIMFILGIGLGLGAVSPWSGEGIGGSALGVSTILWITVTSLVASALGGYLSGRLRTRWLAVHGDEVFFRDTAHGFLAWGLSTLLVAMIFTSATAGIAKLGAQAGATVAGGIAETASTAAIAGAASSGDASEGTAADPLQGALAYHLDALFRTSVLNQVQVNALSAGGASPETMVTPQGAGNRNWQPPQAAPFAQPEVARIFTRALANDELPRDDATYVGRLVAQHTGLSEMEATTRVAEVFTRTQAELAEMERSAREVADEARAASMKTALWFFVALLAGAFLGSYSATLGGRQRDF